MHLGVSCFSFVASIQYHQRDWKPGRAAFRRGWV